MRKFIVGLMVMMFFVTAAFAGARVPGNMTVEGGTVVVGDSESEVGIIDFKNSTNTNYVAIQSGTTSGSYTLTLPAADAEGFLKSDGAGNLSFSSDSVAYDDISDPDASGSISFGEYTATYTSDNATWGGIIIQDSAAEIGAATLLSIDVSVDSADADWTAIEIKDAAGTLFDFGGDGVLAFANGETLDNSTDGQITTNGDFAVDSTKKVILNTGDSDSYIMVETDDDGKMQFYVAGSLALELE